MVPRVSPGRTMWVLPPEEGLVDGDGCGVFVEAVWEEVVAVAAALDEPGIFRVLPMMMTLGLTPGLAA